jgi:hypothetical protein
MANSAVALIRKHPLIAAMDVLIFVFALLELAELWWHVGLHLVLPEAILQIVTTILRIIAVWHAARHL